MLGSACTVKSTVIDDIDSEILGVVQKRGRITQRELGREVGLSPNAAGARLQRLIDRKIIVGFEAKVDHDALGRPIEATIDVWLVDGGDRSAIMVLVADDERVVECFHLTGPLDFRIRARVASAEDLNDLLNRLREEGGVRQTDSRLILEQLSTKPQ